MKHVMVLLLLILSGCASVPKSPKIITKEVKIPVIKPCDIQITQNRVNFLTRLTKESTIDEIVKVLIAQVKFDENYIKQLEAALSYCKNVSQENGDETQ